MYFFLKILHIAVLAGTGWYIGETLQKKKWPQFWFLIAVLIFGLLVGPYITEGGPYGS